MAILVIVQARFIMQHFGISSKKINSWNTTSTPGVVLINNPILRLLPPFAGALREKNRTRASFNKIRTNYISVESLLNVLYEKNTILAMFSFSMYQEAVRRETNEGSSIEFIGYRIPPHEQNGCTVLFTRHQSTKVCRAFSIF